MLIKDAVLLGSTGSIGINAAETLKRLNIHIRSLCAGTNYVKLEQQARLYKPEAAALFDERAAAELKVRLKDTPVKVMGGLDGILEAASMSSDLAVNAIVGIIGLEPTIAAIKSCNRLAIANKETLVCAGSIVLEQARLSDTAIIPVDSEHSAIFQSLLGCDNSREVRKIILTASGGPFFGYTPSELEHVTVQDTLRHPNWNMGRKITVDSATLMNKGLEVIEAMHLFGKNADDIEVVVHRESIIHSMVEYIDGSVIAQLGLPDMRIPIQYAVTYPNRADSSLIAPDFTTLGSLTFSKPDTDTFKCLGLAYKYAGMGDGACTVLNGANEKAVELYLNGKIMFNMIPDVIEYTMGQVKFPVSSALKIDDIINLDFEAKHTAEDYVNNKM